METAFEFRAVPASVAAARDATRTFIASLPIVSEDALVVVSELVANAVRHGVEPIALCLAWDGRVLRIEVSDGDSCVERVKAVAPSAVLDHGRGLVLTDHLAASWGAHEGPRGLGKTVWATISS
jgi:anti-sigma regulatory factor (Ser/Thr protein kinase)